MDRLLVVDDDRTIRDLVTRYLATEDVEIDTADNGADAIRCLRASQYQSILLDLMMPGISGFGVLEYLKSEQPAMIERVIVMTSRTLGESGRICNIDFGRRVLAKPFTAREIRAKVLGVAKRFRS